MIDFDTLDQLEREVQEPKESKAAGPSLEDQGWILIRPLNGLCNRLSAMLSAAVLAADTGRQVAVDWRITDTCGCSWDRLFAQSTLQVGARTRVWLLTEELLKKLEPMLCGIRILDRICPSADEMNFASAMAARATLPPLQLPCCGLACWLDLESPMWLEHPRCAGMPACDLPLALQAPCTVIAAFSEFYPSARLRDELVEVRSEILRALAPSPQVLRRTSELPRGTVGVHIRRTDHEAACSESPDSLFLEAMDKAAEELGPRFGAFFLATDEPEVEELMLQRYGNRLMCHKKRSLCRKTPEAIEDAFVDLLSLSKCDLILGSFMSSFSALAALLQQRPLRTVRKSVKRPSSSGPLRREVGPAGLSSEVCAACAAASIPCPAMR
ncbi:unnamed protein product [Symbiodinium natans]|uniref:Uncharacterized protein n=1 Tax=Symbiodinium natans TaxID=878477 RepID=A0A812GWR2_9DINO|nr:unnamed protein product [Symbiodinium natans]